MATTSEAARNGPALGHGRASRAQGHFDSGSPPVTLACDGQSHVVDLGFWAGTTRRSLFLPASPALRACLARLWTMTPMVLNL